jgi:hypothetical protein
MRIDRYQSVRGFCRTSWTTWEMQSNLAARFHILDHFPCKKRKCSTVAPLRLRVTRRACITRDEAWHYIAGWSLVGSCRPTLMHGSAGHHVPESWRLAGRGRGRDRMRLVGTKHQKETRRAIAIHLKDGAARRSWATTTTRTQRSVQSLTGGGWAPESSLTAQAPALYSRCYVLLPLCLRVGPWRRREATPVACSGEPGGPWGPEKLRHCTYCCNPRSPAGRSCSCILLASHRLLGHWKTPCATRLVNWTSDYRRPHQSFSLRPVHSPCRSGRLGRGSSILWFVIS